MDQRRRGQSLAGIFPRQFRRRQLSQFVVNRGQLRIGFHFAVGAERRVRRPSGRGYFSPKTILTLPLVVAAVLWLPTLAVRGQEQKRDPDYYAPVIATRGDVEITEISIERRKASGAVKHADLTKLEIELWLKASKEGGPRARALLKVVELGPIETIPESYCPRKNGSMD